MLALIVDDDPIYRKLASLILRDISQITEILEADSCAAARNIVQTSTPSFCAIDWMLDDGEGTHLGREIRAIFPAVQLVLLTAFPSKELPRELIGAGFGGYIDKSSSVDRVKEAFESVISGGMFFASTVPPHAAVAGSSSGATFSTAVQPGSLTPREREITAMVAKGKMTKEIAYELKLSPRTVDKHRSNILKKLEIGDVASLTRWSLRVGLIEE
ncbi:MAG: response regulator transcription factor [Synoicihabitans sp.]